MYINTFYHWCLSSTYIWIYAWKIEIFSVWWNIILFRTERVIECAMSRINRDDVFRFLTNSISLFAHKKPFWFISLLFFFVSDVCTHTFNLFKIYSISYSKINFGIGLIVPQISPVDKQTNKKIITSDKFFNKYLSLL